MIVWQDMVNGGGYFKGPHTWIPNVLLPFQKGISDTSGNYWFFGRRNQKGREEFVREAAHTMALLSHFPSVATYVLFNEGWGQFEASRLTSVLKRRFPGSGQHRERPRQRPPVCRCHGWGGRYGEDTPQ